MKNRFFPILILLFATKLSFAQKKVTDATIYYDIVVSTDNNTPKRADMLDGATNIVYVKGNMSRSDFISSLGASSTIFDEKTSTATNIRDYGNKKFLITYSPAEWKTYNKRYEGVTYKIENEFKQIAGYKCQKAIGKLSDGTTFTVFFTKELIPVNTNFQTINKGLPGLAMQYDASKGKDKVTFTVSNIEFNPVPLAKFDIPKTGYRAMSYTEFSKQAK
ncbi:GLPGLI family protein [Niabella ginsengisoli]|uniref:GLPGLI family protein n=1 Tax=Niabella ginsengisoli TaxID=522298 RepID=A0ABS9SF97_9BACT|nr:GLPGLI family protein [Niabella ginsengisoli]MCH5597033.1 GLPGLI family protein [Niabella ginsengisoli]